MAKLNELYDEKMWNWLIFQIENKVYYLYEEEYGYVSNNWAFDEENHVPANVLLIKYKEKYYVYIDYMENDYYDVPEVFDE